MKIADYVTREWDVVEVPFEFEAGDRVAPTDFIVCGIDSGKAKQMEEDAERWAETHDEPYPLVPFFYDAEQVLSNADMDAVYGVYDVMVAKVEIEFPGGVVASPGALVFSIHRLDFPNKSHTVLVERLG